MRTTRLRAHLVGLLCLSVGLASCQADSAVQPSPSSDTAARDDAPAQTDSLRYTLRTVSGGYEAWANVNSDQCELLPQAQRQSPPFDIVFE